jgi:hypothetical protein
MGGGRERLRNYSDRQARRNLTQSPFSRDEGLYSKRSAGPFLEENERSVVEKLYFIKKLPNLIIDVYG